MSELSFNVDINDFADRLKSKKEIEELYNNGSIVFSDDKKIKAVYKIYDGKEKIGLFYTVAVHKKAGNAVWRNRAKRLLRDAFRLNKYGFLSYCANQRILLKIIFSPNSINSQISKKLNLADFVPAMRSILSSFGTSV